MSQSDSLKSATYSQFACIGSGFSAIALGATLKRWHGITDVRFFERHSDLGGTWFVNQYPGCACDVPSLLYSLSFAPNPDWSKSLAPQDEIREYLNTVADEYGLREKTTFGATVEKCQWIEQTHRWRLFIRDGETDSVFVHESQFLFSGSGLLVFPRKLDVPGVETFNGPIFHASQWRHDVDLQDKNVVVVGNGCTASQLIPAIHDKTRHITQFVRSKHWIIPTIHVPQTNFMRFLFRTVPGCMAFCRFAVFAFMENDMRGFYMTKAAAAYRRYTGDIAERYMKDTAPEKYHDMLIPDFEIGCKRRIFDPGYLKSLHADDITLTDDPIVEVTPNGVRSKNGFTKADVILLANGYETNSFMTNIEIVGRGGVNTTQHWESRGGPGAYNSTSLSGFPNFFIILGPNTGTGHTSTIMAAENAINYSLRLIKPILDGGAIAVDVKPEAETRLVEQIQKELHKTVWFSGCSSWYNKEVKGSKPRNSMAYPYSQAYFWYQCLFPIYKDFVYDPAPNPPRRSAWPAVLKAGLLTGILISAGSVLISDGKNAWDFGRYLPLVKDQVHYLKSTLPLWN